MNFNKVKSWIKVIILMFILFILSIVIATSIGAVSISMEKAYYIMFDNIFFENYVGNYISSEETIIWQVRLPRVILAALVGIALSTAGTIYQGLFVNPMADPYIIGASSGASLGAAVAIVLTININFLGIGTIPLFAFIGSIITVGIVYNLAKTGGNVPIMPLLLSGIAVSTFVSAIVSLFVYFSGNQIHQIIFWMMGGFSSASWTSVRLTAPYVIIGLCITYYYSRDLNIMLLGDETAHHLGVSVDFTKKVFLITASILTAAAVSVSGIIGFVGLIIPHMMRLIVGPDHRVLLPSASIAGGIFLIITDTIARTIIAPTEIPVGIITAIFGGPFFIYLLKKKKQVHF